MASTQPFRKALSGVDIAIKQGTARALNRALTTAKTQMVRSLREDTGLKTEVITMRTRSRKATQKRLGVILGIATKFGIALSKFKPKLKKVKVKQKNGRKVTHYGVSIKIGRAARALAPGAFFLVGKTGEAVIGRKGAYDASGKYVNPTAPKYRTANLKTFIFSDSAKANEAKVRQAMVDAFDKNVGHEIEFAVSNKFKSKS